jgi:hypothetical protein
MSMEHNDDVLMDNEAQELEAASLNEVSNLSKEESLEALQGMKDKALDSNALRLLREHMDLLLQQEEEEARARFQEQEGDPDGFEFKKDASHLAFDELHKELRQKVQEDQKKRDRERKSNLQLKLGILDQMRELLQQEESKETIDAFKKLQEEWKQVGAVPGQESEELWKNYHGVCDIFYNNLKVYTQMIELDRRKNYDQKMELVQRIEMLGEHKNPLHAQRELRSIQDEWRHIGHVPRELMDEVSERYQKAMELMKTKKNAYLDTLRQAKEENFKIKSELLEKVKAFQNYSSQRIDEWKTQTEALFELQKEWKKSGPLPEDKGKDLTREFWDISKAFFHTKSVFFKELDGKRKENQTLKEQLLAELETLKDSDDYKKAAARIKDLQVEWKKIGQVPIKYKDSLQKKFKEAADAFFDKQRKQSEVQEESFKQNLEQKHAFITSLSERALPATGLKAALDSIMAEWEALGMVPREQKQAVFSTFLEAMKGLLDKTPGLSPEQKEQGLIELEVRISNMGGDKTQLEKRGKDLGRKIKQLEEEIGTLKTNLDFFGRSNKASQLKAEYEQKVAALEVDLKKLLVQKKLLKG